MLALLTLALAAAGAHAANTTTTLRPVLRPECDKKDPANLVPSNDITLSYGAADESLVSVVLAMKYPSVVLEEVAAIAAVACADSSITVTFNETAAFEQTSREWQALDDFVMVTNHLGNCDVEKERGFFLVDTITWDEGSLQVIANAHKSDVANTATSTEISFSNVPVQNPAAAKRDIKTDENGLHITNTLALPAATTLFTYDPYVAITADEASLTSNMTFSGKLKYTVEQLELDIDTYFGATLGLTVDVKAPYSGNFTYDPEDLGYNFVDIPGIIKLGPALGFAIGVELEADAVASITTDFGLTFPDAKLHLDLVNSAATSATGWDPVWTAHANISEKAAVGVNPYVDLGVELVFEILGGAVGLSSGVTTRSKLVNDFKLSASQGVGTGGVGIGQDNTGCQEGFAIKSDFFFSVVGFATQWWSQELYKVEVPVADECYTWL
ncbi:isoamyl alcohol oxidase/reductase/dehydrogenase [Colletotrichum tofieldiae]|nr:isoamyl alcohol oxidase/reductase/dehydrogenase [Colletotrichum tofieldiae]GKT94279.1 isoamyl alcohol oxidase/reductase/dehydrogenase [Colletotrichum tofieldiae]